MELCEQGRYDTLAEGIVERVVDRRWQDPVSLPGLAIDRYVQHRGTTLLVRGDIGHSGNSFELIEVDCRPMVELGRIGVGQGILVQRLGDAATDGYVLRRLQIEGDALGLRELRSEPSYHLLGADAALGKRLQYNKYAPLVECRGRAARADIVGNRIDSGILHHGVYDRLLTL